MIVISARVNCVFTRVCWLVSWLVYQLDYTKTTELISTKLKWRMGLIHGSIMRPESSTRDGEPFLFYRSCSVVLEAKKKTWKYQISDTTDSHRLNQLGLANFSLAPSYLEWKYNDSLTWLFYTCKSEWSKLWHWNKSFFSILGCEIYRPFHIVSFWGKVFLVHRAPVGDVIEMVMSDLSGKRNANVSCMIKWAGS